MESASLSGHSANSGSDNQEKPDLPGRVSFSKSDVYEIDFSDYDNDDELLANYSNSTNKTSLTKLIRSPTSVQANPEHCEPHDYCCSLKCNAMDCRIDEDDSVVTDDAVNGIKKDDVVDQIIGNTVIEDYKKEIESLNLKHGNNVAEKDGPSDNITSLPTITDVPRLNLNRLSENAQPSPTDTDKYSDKGGKFNNGTSVNVLNLKPLNNNGGNSEHDAKPNEIIKNYLKVTNRNENYVQSPSKQNNLTKVTKTVKVTKKTKQAPAPLEKNKPKPKVGDKLDEFQMEKVESWMSIHEKRFSDSKFDVGDLGGAYNNDWRETPNSKTDDEGNFSFEDPIDDISNEESNYDDIVSVIKEIDEEKSKDLGKRLSELAVTFEPKIKRLMIS